MRNLEQNLPFLPRAATLAVATAMLSAPPLAVSAPRMLEQVTVVGGAEGAARIPGSAHHIDAEALEKHEYSDIHRILREVPGVNLQEEDGYGLRPNIGIRGTGVARSQRITLMEDGILTAPAPYAAPAAYYFPTVGRLSSVEVRKGSSAIQYGPNTTGGALNLISTPVPRSFGGRLETSIGEDDTRRLHATLGDGGTQFGWLLETFQHTTDGFKQLDGGGDTGFDTQDYLGKVRLNSGAEAAVYQELELKVGGYDEISNETYLGLTDADFSLSPFRRYAASQRDEMNADQQQYSVRHYAELRPGLDIATTLYRQDVARNWYKLDKAGGASISTILSDPTNHTEELALIRGADSADDALRIKANNREYRSEGAQTRLGLSFAGGAARHDLQLGLRYHSDEEDRFQHADLYKMENGTLVQTTAGAPGSESNRIASADAWAGFVQDTITFGAWTLQPGLRYESIETRRKDYGTSDPQRTGNNLTVATHKVDVWIPGLGATWQATPRLTLLAGAHRGFTPPAPGNEVDPEKSLNLEAGLRYREGELQGEVIAFFNDYSNLLGTCTASSGGDCTVGDQFQGGEVEVKGVEAGLSRRFTPEDTADLTFPVRLAYTYTDARFRNSFASGFKEWGTVETGDELPYLPQHQLAAAVGVETGPWRLDLAAKYQGEMRTVAGQGSIPESERIAAHTVVDLGGEYQLTEQGKLFFAVENLLDKTYAVARRPAGLRPGKPRAVMAGLKLNF